MGGPLSGQCDWKDLCASGKKWCRSNWFRIWANGSSGSSYCSKYGSRGDRRPGAGPALGWAAPVWCGRGELRPPTFPDAVRKLGEAVAGSGWPGWWREVMSSRFFLWYFSVKVVLSPTDWQVFKLLWSTAKYFNQWHRGTWMVNVPPGQLESKNVANWTDQMYFNTQPCNSMFRGWLHLWFRMLLYSDYFSSVRICFTAHLFLGPTVILEGTRRKTLGIAWSSCGRQFV